ncbi:hypothetical protein JCM17960_02970 [Magnetospira thiophila]
MQKFGTQKAIKGVRVGLAGICLTTLLSGCLATGGLQPLFVSGADRPQAGSLSAFVPAGKSDTEVRQVAAEGIKALDEGRLKDASTAFNAALQFDLTNSYLLVETNDIGGIQPPVVGGIGPVSTRCTTDRFHASITRICVTPLRPLIELAVLLFSNPLSN